MIKVYNFMLEANKTYLLTLRTYSVRIILFLVPKTLQSGEFQDAKTFQPGNISTSY